MVAVIFLLTAALPFGGGGCWPIHSLRRGGAVAMAHTRSVERKRDRSQRALALGFAPSCGGKQMKPIFVPSHLAEASGV